jgi:hypothetical protein
MKPVLEVLMNNIKNLVESAKLGSTIEHSGLKGKVKEELLSNFFLIYLSRKWEIGNGKIQDGNGKLSAETDLIIYDADSLPKSMLSSSVGVYPVESCRYVFEVKSTINATEIKSTIKKFNLLKKFNSRGQKRPFRILFAYSSDLTTGNEIERIKKYDSDFHTNPAIDILLVIGKGYWSHAKRNYLFQESKQKATTSFYYESISKQNNFEIAILLSAMLNTLNPELPNFSAYMSGFKDFNDLKPAQEVVLDVEENSQDIISEEKDKLIVKHEIFEHKNEFYWFKKPNKLNLLFRKKYQVIKEPVIEFTLINDGTENIYITSIIFMTSKQLVFFLPISNLYGFLEYPVTIQPNSNFKIGTKFACFPKIEGQKPGGKFKMEKGGMYLWEHNYEFKNTSLETFGIAKIRTSNNQSFYSDEINLSNLEKNERYNHLDILLHSLGPPTDKIIGDSGMVIAKGKNKIRHTYVDSFNIKIGKE